MKDSTGNYIYIKTRYSSVHYRSCFSRVNMRKEPVPSVYWFQIYNTSTWICARLQLLAHTTQEYEDSFRNRWVRNRLHLTNETKVVISLMWQHFLIQPRTSDAESWLCSYYEDLPLYFKKLRQTSENWKFVNIRVQMVTCNCFTWWLCFVHSNATSRANHWLDSGQLRNGRKTNIYLHWLWELSHHRFMYCHVD